MNASRPLVVSVPDEQLLADLQPVPHGVDLVPWDLTGAPPRPRFDIVVPPYMGGTGALSALDGVDVRLVQSQSIGYDGVAAALPAGHVFANAASVHETSTAELAVGLALAMQRHLPEYVRSQERGEWAPLPSESLADRRVLLLGYGGVGKAIAARLRPFEVEMTAIARRARVEDDIEVRAIGDLHACAASADILFVSLPGGDETRHIVGETVLSALPDGALVVNVGRGPLVDTDALVTHVRRGRIRAALDVTDPEPLPPGHPLWTLPGVLVAPHVGGASSAMRPRMARLVRRQIERMLAGESPLNVVLSTR